MTDQTTPSQPSGDLPPITGRWGTLYTVVLVELAVCILLLYLFYRTFS